MTTENTADSLIVDAEYDICGINPPQYVVYLDKQGMVPWDQEKFGKSLLIPPLIKGIEFFYNQIFNNQLRIEGRRPLNGHFALWLVQHQEQIPEEWKCYEMLFLSTVIGIDIPMNMDKTLTCLRLRYKEGKWGVDIFNLASNTLGPRHRIPLLPE
jgi:hypothetical protein